MFSPPIRRVNLFHAPYLKGQSRLSRTKGILNFPENGYLFSQENIWDFFKTRI